MGNGNPILRKARYFLSAPFHFPVYLADRMKAGLHLQSFFKEQLQYWHQHINTRILPWKQETDPYKIWLSEIILQQTRAEQGLPYYLQFIRQYPDIKSLALAPQEEVFRLWQGLGYYTRCKNLHRTAKLIHHEYGGKFPDNYEGLLALPGVGAYTAAAIASFAFGLPCAVVDGNVYRVLARFFGIDLPVDTSEGKECFAALASELIDLQHPAAANQAIMDFGALVCKPRQPACMDCPLSPNCVAYQRERIPFLPVKSRSLSVRVRHFHYLILEYRQQVYIRERPGKDIWQHLYEFYLIETEGDFRESEHWKRIFPSVLKVSAPLFEHRQRLTHQLICSTFYEVKLKDKPEILEDSGIWRSRDSLKKFAFPGTIVSFFNQNNYF